MLKLIQVEPLIDEVMGAHKNKKEAKRQERRIAKQELRLTLQVFVKPIVDLRSLLVIQGLNPEVCLN